jgi:biopolymer transport protein ExbD
MKLCPETASSRNSGDDNLIPLINVVFLMLIFFMVAGQIQRSDAVKLEPPQSVSETPHIDEKVTVLVDLTGALYLENNPVSDDAFVTELNQLFETAKDQKAFMVLVKVDNSLPVTRLQEVLKLIKSAGLMKVSLATRLTPTAPAVEGAGS